MATDTFTTPGADTWTCPANVISIDVLVIGGGGGGGTGNGWPGDPTPYSCGGSAGGGGASALLASYAVVPGQTYNLYVGSAGPGASGGAGRTGTAGGDSYFGSAAICMAKGGLPGKGYSTVGAGGSAAASVGDSTYGGGNGGSAAGSTFTGYGGGGGGSGGSAANGNNGSSWLSGGLAAGATAVTGGGPGGASGQSPASGPGGGGGGGNVSSYLYAQSNFGNGGSGYNGQVRITYTAVTNAPNAPTLTSPTGAETWREGETRNVTWTPASPEHPDGAFECEYAIEFSALGTFADAVEVADDGDGGTYPWTIPLDAVAADTTTCKLRIRAHVVNTTLYSSWSTSDAFDVLNSTAPTVTLIDPEDDELFQGELDLKPTFTFGTADTESDPVHAELIVSYSADYSAPVIDTDSATDYADWEEAEDPFTTWTTMGSGGATAGNRIRYKPSAQLRYDYCYGKVRLKDAYSTAVFTEFEFTIVVDPDLHLSVTIGGVPYNVGACHIVENTGGEPSPITLQIDLDQYADEPLTDTATVSIASGLGNHNRVWNGTLEPWTMEGVVVNGTIVQDDFYLSHLDVPGDYESADLGAQFAAIIGDCGEGKLTASHVDITTGVSAAISGKYRYIREVLQQILAACPAYLGWVDAGADVWLIDQADLPAATICLYEEDPTGAAVTIPGGLTGVRILPGASVQIGTLDRANRVRCIVRNSSPLVVATATNTTVAPTFATSPRTHVMYLESGDATFAAAVAAAQLAFLRETRYVLNGIPVRLEDGLGIRLGTAVHIIIPRCGIDTTAGDPYPVRHVEHDFGSAESVIDVGEYAAPRDDPEFLFAVAASLDQLRKETAIT